MCSEQLDESVDSMVKAQLEMALPQVIHEKFEQQMGTLIAEKAITQEQLTYALAPAINDIRNLFGASTRQDATFASLTLRYWIIAFHTCQRMLLYITLQCFPFSVLRHRTPVQLHLRVNILSTPIVSISLLN